MSRSRYIPDRVSNKNARSRSNRLIRRAVRKEIQFHMELGLPAWLRSAPYFEPGERPFVFVLPLRHELSDVWVLAKLECW